MSVTFTLTPADLRAFTRHARKSMPEFRRLRWFNLSLAALIAFSTSLTATSSSSLPACILTFLILAAIIWLLMTAISAAVNWLISSFRPNTAGLLCGPAYRWYLLNEGFFPSPRREKGANQDSQPPSDTGIGKKTRY